MTDREAAAYKVACAMVASWPKWKRDTIEKNIRITPKLRAALTRAERTVKDGN